MHRVTVLMPVFNCGEFLHEAIDSILGQTYEGFDFLIINDGSTDQSESVIKSYTDSRIKYIKNDINSGIVESLNKGIRNIETEYIIRMDGDDISIPERIEKQVSYMDKHPEIGVSSSYISLFGKKTTTWKPYLFNNQIKAELLFNSSIMHAAAIIRTDVIKKNDQYYSSLYPHMEDYDLWYRLSQYTKFGNIDTVLYKYRKHDRNITDQKNRSLIERKSEFFKAILNDLGIVPTEQELRFHQGYETGAFPLNYNTVLQYKQYLNKLLDTNKFKKRYAHNDLKNLLNLKWDLLFEKIPIKNIKLLFRYWKVTGKIKNSHLIHIVKCVFNKMKL